MRRTPAAAVRENAHVEADEYRELDNERVLVFVHWSGRRKTSGLELGQTQAKAAAVFHVRRQGEAARHLLVPRARARRPRSLPEGDLNRNV